MYLGILDDLNGYLQGNVWPLIVKMPLWFPLIMAGIVLGIVLAVHGIKTEVKLDTREKTELPDVEDWADEEGMRKAAPPVQPNGYGDDLEGRLIAALAGAPWRVKDGSEIALSKSENGKWGIVTNRIVFALPERSENPTNTPKEELLEQPPPPKEQEEGVVE